MNFNEVFSLIDKHTFIRVMMFILTRIDLELQQINVKIVFLHGDLEKVIHMEPEGFQKYDARSCCLLKRALYGLK